MLQKIRYLINLMIKPIVSVKRHRHLLYEFISREIKSRFAGTMAGGLWVLINPFITIIVYVFIFSMVLRIQVSAEETGTDSFLIYFLSGFFPWILVSESLSRSVGVLIENANLITKVVFPVELLPVGTVISSFVINGIGFLLFCIYLVAKGYFNISWFFLIALVLLQILFAGGLSYLFAATCVFIRDIREVLGILLMVWFYATPIIYPVSMVPDSFKTVLNLNPMKIFIDLYRDFLLRHHIDGMAFLYLCITTVLIYGAGAIFFMRAKPAFGDVL